MNNKKNLFVFSEKVVMSDKLKKNIEREKLLIKKESFRGLKKIIPSIKEWNLGHFGIGNFPINERIKIWKNDPERH